MKQGWISIWLLNVGPAGLLSTLQQCPGPGRSSEWPRWSCSHRVPACMQHFTLWFAHLPSFSIQPSQPAETELHVSWCRSWSSQTESEHVVQKSTETLPGSNIHVRLVNRKGTKTHAVTGLNQEQYNIQFHPRDADWMLGSVVAETLTACLTTGTLSGFTGDLNIVLRR